MIQTSGVLCHTEMLTEETNQKHKNYQYKLPQRPRIDYKSTRGALSNFLILLNILRFWFQEKKKLIFFSYPHLPSSKEEAVTDVQRSPSAVSLVTIAIDEVASCVICALTVVFPDMISCCAVVSLSEVTLDVVASSIVCAFLEISVNLPIFFAVVCLAPGVFVVVNAESKMFTNFYQFAATVQFT